MEKPIDDGAPVKSTRCKYENTLGILRKKCGNNTGDKSAYFLFIPVLAKANGKDISNIRL